jgi:hypothetical protein
MNAGTDPIEWEGSQETSCGITEDKEVVEGDCDGAWLSFKLIARKHLRAA